MAGSGKANHEWFFGTLTRLGKKDKPLDVINLINPNGRVYSFGKQKGAFVRFPLIAYETEYCRLSGSLSGYLFATNFCTDDKLALRVNGEIPAVPHCLKADDILLMMGNRFRYTPPTTHLRVKSNEPIFAIFIE